jgi:hypothetical protein
MGFAARRPEFPGVSGAFDPEQVYDQGMRTGGLSGQTSTSDDATATAVAPELGALAAAVEGLSVPVDGDVLVELLGLADRLQARIHREVDGFDRAGLWDLEGASSLTAWLRDRARCSNRAAVACAKTVRRLRHCPTLRAAWADGVLSSGQVEAVMVNVSDKTVALFESHEADIVGIIEDLSVADTVKAMQRWAAQAEAVVDDGEPSDERRRSLHHSRTLGGRGRLDGDFDPDSDAVIRAALRHATGDGYDPDDFRTPAETRADALIAVCQHFLGHNNRGEPRRRRPHVNIIIPLSDLTNGRPGATDDGTILSGETIRKMACDADINRCVTNGGSVVLDYGTTTRVVPRALFAALVIRDGHCRFPGCDRRVDWCEAHHVRHWTNGGPTNQANLVLLCSRHHHTVHKPHWTATLHPDTARFTVTNPNGHTRTTQPILRL